MRASAGNYRTDGGRLFKNGGDLIAKQNQRHDTRFYAKF
jgi:hypothetical protein